MVYYDYQQFEPIRNTIPSICQSKTIDLYYALAPLHSICNAAALFPWTLNENKWSRRLERNKCLRIYSMIIIILMTINSINGNVSHGIIIKKMGDILAVYLIFTVTTNIMIMLILSNVHSRSIAEFVRKICLIDKTLRSYGATFYYRKTRYFITFFSTFKLCIFIGVLTLDFTL